MEGWSVLQRLSSVPVALARRLALFALRLARLSLIAGSVAAALIVLDTILLPDEDKERATAGSRPAPGKPLR